MDINSQHHKNEGGGKQHKKVKSKAKDPTIPTWQPWKCQFETNTKTKRKRKTDTKAKTETGAERHFLAIPISDSESWHEELL